MAEVLKGSLTEKERKLLDMARDMLVDFSEDGKLSRVESVKLEQAFEKAYEAGLQDPGRHGGAKKGGGHSR